MQFAFGREQFEYEIFPKIAEKGAETQITVRLLGKRSLNIAGDYYVEIYGLDCGGPGCYPASADASEETCTKLDNRTLEFAHTFMREQEYRIRLFDPEGEQVEWFSVYCLEKDLFDRIPLRGDLHLHSCRSDGVTLPSLVVSCYRGCGYDFLAVTDHSRYYPSLEAMDFCSQIKTGLVCVPGEEVQLPECKGHKLEQHIINFGGEYSVNGMIDGKQHDEVGDDPKFRSLNGVCPKHMTRDEFGEMIEELAKDENVPENIDLYPYTIAKFIFSEIRKANGLAIWVHPNWLQNTFHTPEAFSDYLVENKLFDAFEVLGGETYNQQNGYQTYRYYNDMARGYRYPVVGSTDSHSPFENNKSGRICSTIIFAEKNERTALIEAVKDFYSVAIDTISHEYRIVGERRLARYADFLIREYLPYHDDACYEEGRLMRQYAVGTEEEKAEAKRLLEIMDGKVEKIRKKYIGK